MIGRHFTTARLLAPRHSRHRAVYINTSGR
jgi:hypothetical protein